MKALMFLSLVLGTTTASYKVNMANIEDKIRLIKPIFMMGEGIFRKADENQCLLKVLCLVEKGVSDDVINPLKHFSRYLTNSHLDVEPAAHNRLLSLIQLYPKITEMFNSILYGRAINDTESCAKQFSRCDVSSVKLLSEAIQFDDNHVSYALSHKNTKRFLFSSPCDAAGTTCSVVGAGCGICSLFTEGLCGIACGAEVGAACAGSDAGCKVGGLFGNLFG